jgi:hypothetical protein
MHRRVEVLARTISTALTDEAIASTKSSFWSSKVSDGSKTVLAVAGVDVGAVVDIPRYTLPSANAIDVFTSLVIEAMIV